MKTTRRQQVSSFFKRLRHITRRREKRHRGFGSHLRNRLVIGLLVAFPLVVTIFFARFVFGVLDRWFRPISVKLFDFAIPGAGMLLALIGLYMLGSLATNVFGSRLLDSFETFLSRLPLISPIYQGARQITEAVQLRGTRDFKDVVLIRFPHPGVRSIGFVTREFTKATSFGDAGTYMVFVPTTPNPTSGFLVAAPRDDVEVLGIDVEEGIKLVISGGLLTPDILLRSPGQLPPGDTDSSVDDSSIDDSSIDDSSDSQ
jgi:uncharacterized membrane protein